MDFGLIEKKMQKEIIKTQQLQFFFLVGCFVDQNKMIDKALYLIMMMGVYKRDMQVWICVFVYLCSRVNQSAHFIQVSVVQSASQMIDKPKIR